MIGNDIRFAFRQLRRNKLLSVINVLGLTIGISACLVIFLIANHEMSFDRFQPDQDRIYRIYSQFHGVFSGVNRGVPIGVAQAIKNDFSGIESSARFHTYSAKVDVPDGNGTKPFELYSKIILTEPDYFKLFDYYAWSAGDPENALKKPFGVVLTESRAKTYFGDLTPQQFLGKEIHYADSLILNVTGIVKDVEEKTDLDFTDFISLSTTQSSWLKDNFQEDDWGSTNSSTQFFIKLNPGIDKSVIENQMSRLEKMYKEKNTDSEWENTPTLQSINDIHFGTSELGVFDNTRAIPEKSTLEFLMVVAVLILVIATINFINLETAQASRRAKEVGVRKVLGSSRGKLIRHFLIGSFMLTTFSVLLSMVVSYGAIQFFHDFMPPDLKLDLSDRMIQFFLLGCIAGVTLLAGLYPAFVMSSFNPALALKNLAYRNSATSRSAFIRKTLTVFQFSFSQVLIIVTLAIGMQISFMLNKDLGFESKGIVYINTPWYEKPGKRDVLKNELAQLAEVSMVSRHSNPPSANGHQSSGYKFNDGSQIREFNIFRKSGDTSYFKLYNIELLAGRNVQPVDSIHEYVINETGMKLLGFSDPNEIIGKTFEDKSTIVGVMKDFHSKSLHRAMDPIMFNYNLRNGNCIALKFSASKISDITPVMAKVESSWKKIYPDAKFEYKFLDETIERFYQNEKRTGTLARTATVIAIVISCLGLFGLSSFTVIQRTKEIGIRKVLGATVNSILMLLSKDFVVLVLIAFVLASPLAWYATDQWLAAFAYRMDIQPWLFIAAALISLVTAFATISFKTVNAAKADPVDSLRYE